MSGPSVEIGKPGLAFVQRAGDGSIIEFRSVVDTVRCAIEVQNGIDRAQRWRAGDRRIEFRVGIHVGDVVEESDGDLMGDRVNIAARLEGIAAPGAVCLSEDADPQVGGRLEMEVQREQTAAPPCYWDVTSSVASPSIARRRQVHDLPASDAAVPVAVGKRPFPEAVKPVTFPSVIVSASFPSVSS
jgi:adenylate cyclase